MVYGQIKADVGRIVRELSERKGVKIIEAECCVDHIHMLVAIPPHMSVSQYMGYLKSKSSLMIFDRHVSEIFLSQLSLTESFNLFITMGTSLANCSGVFCMPFFNH